MLLLEDLDLLTKTRTDETVSKQTQTTEVGRLAELPQSFRRGGEGNSRSGLLVLERLQGNSLDAHDVYM